MYHHFLCKYTLLPSIRLQLNLHHNFKTTLIGEDSEALVSDAEGMDISNVIVGHRPIGAILGMSIIGNQEDNIHHLNKDEGIYLLGTHIKGGHNGCTQLGKFRLLQMTKVLPVFRMLTHIQTFHSMVAIANPTMEDVYAVEQGYTDTNLWLEWMKYTVHQANRSDCYVCAGARPHLGTVPLNLDYEAELCLVSLFTNMTEGNACEEWKKRYPIVAKAFSPGKGITIYPGNYTCYNVSGQGRDMGRFRDGFCGSYSNLTRDHLINQVQSVADVFWICGDMKIRSRVEGNWTGECTLAKALMPIHIAPADHTVKENDFIAHIKINLRTRRGADDDRTSRNTPKGSFDPHVYIDAIGVPRGVPDEYKARDQKQHLYISSNGQTPALSFVLKNLLNVYKGHLEKRGIRHGERIPKEKLFYKLPLQYESRPAFTWQGVSHKIYEE
ncbi:uncharacterized protein ACNLHF_001234 [Anomaloglossus baeobatrachus]